MSGWLYAGLVLGRDKAGYDQVRAINQTLRLHLTELLVRKYK